MAYKELIKSLTPIRSYAKDFFVYGFKSRTDFRQKSPRSYDNEKRRLESWLSPYMTFQQDSRKKNMFLSMDCRTLQHNPLYRLFETKSFTTMDLLLHFFILDILSARGALTLPELWNQLVAQYPVVDKAGNIPDESTVRKKCKEYTELGLLNKEKCGRHVFYSVAKDPINVSAWDLPIFFGSETCPLGVIGFYMWQRLGMGTFPLSFKHHYIFGALDMEIMDTLLQSIREKRKIRITMFSGTKTGLVYPWKLCISTQSGRQYLLGVLNQKPLFFRLDHIASVQMESVYETFPLTDGQMQDILSHLWGTSGGKIHRLYHVEVYFQVNSEETFILQRLEREKRCGKVTKAGPTLYKYEVSVYDPLEMIPWLRTFIGRIVSIHSDHPRLEKRFQADLEALFHLYGIKDLS